MDNALSLKHLHENTGSEKTGDRDSKGRWRGELISAPPKLALCICDTGQRNVSKDKLTQHHNVNLKTDFPVDEATKGRKTPKLKEPQFCPRKRRARRAEEVFPGLSLRTPRCCRRDPCSCRYRGPLHPAGPKLTLPSKTRPGQTLPPRTGSPPGRPPPRSGQPSLRLLLPQPGQTRAPEDWLSRARLPWSSGYAPSRGDVSQQPASRAYHGARETGR